MRRVLVPFVILALVGGIVAFMVMAFSEVSHDEEQRSGSLSTSPPPPPADFAFEPLSLDATKLQASIDGQISGELQPVPETHDIERLVTAYEQVAVAHAAGADNLSVGQAFTDQVIQFHIAHGHGGLARAGELAFAHFLQALTGETPPAKPAAPQEGPSARVASSMVQAAVQRGLLHVAYPGDFIIIARNEGFLDDDERLREEAKPWVHLLFRYRWMRAAKESLNIPIETLLTPYEIIQLRRWQIEVSKAPLEAKLRILDNVRERFKGYDVDEAEAVLRVQAGDSPGAIFALERGLAQARQKNDEPRIQRLGSLRESLRNTP